MDRRSFLATTISTVALSCAAPSWAAGAPAPSEGVKASVMTNMATPGPAGGDARAIAQQAYIYGFPIVDNYRILHAYCVDTSSPQFKANWNTISNTARVYTPADTTIQTPNSDTPYSFVGTDLRAEPLVFTVPPIEKDRYYSLQFVDLYTFNYAYVGSRATGNGGGKYLLAGPGWDGEKPAGIDEVIRCDTDLGMVIYRTQLFDPADLPNVEKIQAQYKVEPLSAFLGEQAPPAAPAIDFYPPLSPGDERKSISFFDELTFLLQFCPIVPEETALREQFATVGIAAGQPFIAADQSPEIQQALHDGIAGGLQALAGAQAELNSGKISSTDLFGTRQSLNGNYLFRMLGAVVGIYGNTAAEAIYPIYEVDATGAPLDGARNRYVLHFAPGQLPPVHAFWSLTMYTLPDSLLYANPIDRYLINSPMLPELTMDADGGLTLIIQHDSPGKDKEANWLPAPAGPLKMAMRLYWPKEAALDGTWTAPPVTRVA